MNLGNALRRKGKLDDAIAEFHTRIRLKPDSHEAHYDLGLALQDQGKVDDAIAEQNAALRLKPDYAEAHVVLGTLLRHQSRFAEALVEFKRGHELGSKKPNWRYPSAESVRKTERLAELDRKLPTILSGKAKPSDAAESLGLAQVCYGRKLHAASARFWFETFQAQPKLGDDMQAPNRYNAACAAVLAGCGQGKDDPPLDDAAKTRWRKQAMDWLTADLGAWSKILESGTPEARQAIAKTLQYWKADPDLAGIREPVGLAKLPAEEQAACRGLWSRVDALLTKCGQEPSK